MTKPKIRSTDTALDSRYQAMIASTVLLDLTFHRFGDKRMADLDGVKMDTHISSTGDVEQVAVSEEAFALSRRLLDLRVGRDLRGLMNRTKDAIKRISVPSFDRDGVYRISYAAVEQAEQILLDAVQEMEPLKYAFREAYDAEVQKMRDLQREKFRARDYPSAWEASERWSIEWSYLETATVPKALSGVSKFIYDRAMKQAQKRATEAVEAVEQTLRAGLLACVEKMRTDLTATTKLGKPRSYRADALAKVGAFFSTFPMRNFIQDGISAEAMAQMTALLQNVPSADALDDEFLRKEVIDGLASIADTVRPFVTDAARAIELPDEE